MCEVNETSFTSLVFNPTLNPRISITDAPPTKSLQPKLLGATFHEHFKYPATNGIKNYLRSASVCSCISVGTSSVIKISGSWAPPHHHRGKKKNYLPRATCISGLLGPRLVVNYIHQFTQHLNLASVAIISISTCNIIIEEAYLHKLHSFL